MKKKMISLRSLQETLNANELKNILGGSDGGGCADGSPSGCYTIVCFDGSRYYSACGSITSEFIFCGDDGARYVGPCPYYT